MTRLFVDRPLSLNQRLLLPPPQSHYLLHVLRLKSGQELRVFNGKEGEWEARIEAISSKSTTLSLTKQVRGQPGPSFSLSLFFAPLKAHRLEMVIEKATELGVTELIPCLTDYTQVRRLNPARLLAIAQEAAEQSGRLTVPEILPLAPLQDQLKNTTQVIFFCDVEASLPPLLDQWRQHQEVIQEKGSVGVVIGPEGGWSPSERALLTTTFPHLISVQLGETILRAETASLTALALLREGLRFSSPPQSAMKERRGEPPQAGALK